MEEEEGGPGRYAVITRKEALEARRRTARRDLSSQYSISIGSLAMEPPRMMATPPAVLCLYVSFNEFIATWFFDKLGKIPLVSWTRVIEGMFRCWN